MTDISDSDVYKALGIPESRTVFSEYFYTGILRLRSQEEADLNFPAKPHYILEVTKYKNEPVVAVYTAEAEVDKAGLPVLDSSGNWVGHKRFHETDKTYETIYSDKTELSRVARSMYNKDIKTHKVRVVDKPLYIEALTVGTNTFTKQLGLGFWEYATTVTDGVVEPTEKTGVFIGLDLVKSWSAPKVRPEDVVKHIKEDNARANQSYSLPIMDW